MEIAISYYILSAIKNLTRSILNLKYLKIYLKISHQFNVPENNHHCSTWLTKISNSKKINKSNNLSNNIKRSKQSRQASNGPSSFHRWTGQRIGWCCSKERIASRYNSSSRVPNKLSSLSKSQWITVPNSTQNLYSWHNSYLKEMKQMRTAAHNYYRCARRVFELSIATYGTYHYF